MYEELYRIWKNEKEKDTLEELPKDFYIKAADYLKRIKEEARMIDKKTIRASLLQIEMQNVKCILQELFRIRCEKLIEKALKGEKIPQNILTDEEQRIFQKISLLPEDLQDFSKQILEGYHPVAHSERERHMVVLRFLRDIPAIIGKDMKTYGPFKTEDIASVLIENAKILIKQGLAEKINVNP